MTQLVHFQGFGKHLCFLFTPLSSLMMQPASQLADNLFQEVLGISSGNVANNSLKEINFSILCRNYNCIQ